MSTKRTVLWAAVGITGFFFCLQLLKPIIDPDFFWHLTTGSWIMDHHSLPHSDPFAFTSPETTDAAQRFTLTSYWLSQALMAASYRLGGMGAIFFLRFVLALLLVFVMLRRREGDPFLFLAFLLMFLVVLDAYSLERPQSWSFVFWALILLLLPRRVGEEVPAFPARHILLVPLLMLCWANLHGGYLLGLAALVLALALEAGRFIHPALHPLARRDFTRLTVAVLLGILFSLANPNTWHAIGYLRNSAVDVAGNMEYISTLDFFRLRGDWRIVVFWALMTLTACGLLLRPRRTDLTELALLMATGLFSLLQIRYIVFFCVLAVPIAARAWSGLPFARIIRVTLLIAGLTLAGIFSWGARTYLPRIQAGSWIYDWYPQTAADFIVAEDLRGPMYNMSDWGGYLMWRLWPGRQVFIDGRFLSTQARDFDLAVINSPLELVNGLPIWKAGFDAYHINYAVFPWWREARLSPLFEAILEDPGWVPVYVVGQAAIFVRDVPVNARVIAEHALSKEKLRRSIAQAIENGKRLATK